MPPEPATSAGAEKADKVRILLVLPFENRSGQPSLEWIREAAPEILTSRFAAAGFAPMSRTDRLYALDHLGLPQGFHPSRASSLKLAQTLDADSIIVGDFKTDGADLIAEAQIVDVPHLRISQTITARGAMSSLISVFGSLAWRLTRELDPGFKLEEETFIAAGKGLRLDAFEQYVRGIEEPDQAERVRHLEQAVKLSPNYGEAWMALGREEYLDQQYEQAAAAFAHVERNSADAPEAGFYRGLSLMFSGDYAGAEKSFGAVAKVLPLAAVLNNQGVALSREGKDGTSLFVQAETADPNDADYHFNTAVSLKRRGILDGALNEIGQSLKLRPNDSEAESLQAEWKRPAAVRVAADSDALAEPLERMKRTFDATAFHQAAQMLYTMDASRLAALSPAERAQKLAVEGRDYLERGLLLESERLFLDAIEADHRCAEAHSGLAEVRERTGDSEGARKEARAALDIAPSAGAHVVLGRLALAAGNAGEAAKQAADALKLEPTSSSALDLQRQAESKTGQKN